MHETFTPHAVESGHLVGDATFLIRNPSSSAAHIGSPLQGKSTYVKQPALESRHMSSCQAPRIDYPLTPLPGRCRIGRQNSRRVFCGGSDIPFGVLY
jgi:hypothetical protein